MLFASLDDETLLKWDLLLSERICSFWSKLLHLRVDPLLKGAETENGSVASPKSVIIHVNETMHRHFCRSRWSGRAMVLRNFQCRCVLLIWIIGQGPTVLTVGSGRVVWIFVLSSTISLFFLPLSWRRSDISLNTF